MIKVLAKIRTNKVFIFLFFVISSSLSFFPFGFGLAFYFMRCYAFPPLFPFPLLRETATLEGPLYSVCGWGSLQMGLVGLRVQRPILSKKKKKIKVQSVYSPEEMIKRRTMGQNFSKKNLYLFVSFTVILKIYVFFTFLILVAWIELSSKSKRNLRMSAFWVGAKVQG